MKLKSNLFLLSLLFAGCATTYQEEGFFLNGYSENRVSSDTFVVTFRANEMTDPSEVYRYALKRSSDVARKNGYRYFAVTNHLDHTSKVRHLHYPSVQLTIRCFEQVPEGDVVYDVYADSLKIK